MFYFNNPLIQSKGNGKCKTLIDRKYRFVNDIDITRRKLVHYKKQLLISPISKWESLVKDSEQYLTDMFKIMIKLDEEIFKECGYPYLKGGYFECTPPFNYIIFKLINKRFASGIIYNKDSQPYGYIQGEFKNGEFIGKWDIRKKRGTLEIEFTHSRFFKGKYGYKDKVPTIGITGFRIWDDKYFGASSPSY